MKQNCKLKWKHILFPIFLLIIVASLNFYVDTGMNYHEGDYKSMAEEIVSGNEVYFAASNGNEREVRRYLILSMPDQVDSIAVGPSLIMCLRKEMTGDDLYYNLGESGADERDILAQFGIMEQNGKTTNRIIFCVDSYFFDKTLKSSFTRTQRLSDYSDYMYVLLGFNPPSTSSSISRLTSVKNKLKEEYTNVRLLFSISYLQYGIKYLYNIGGMASVQKRFGIVDESFDYKHTAYYKADGSWVYSEDFQNKGTDFVIKEAKEYDIAKQFSKGSHISEESKDVFDSLVSYYVGKGVEFDLFLCPLAPALWDRIESEQVDYFVLDELEQFAKDIAQKYDLKITGSYNPYNIGVTDDDFYDCRHMRADCLPLYFDFTKSS